MIKLKAVARGGVGVATAGLMLTTALSGGAATAAPNPSNLAGGGAGAKCITTKDEAPRLAGGAHRGHDHAPVTPSVQAQVERQLAPVERQLAARERAGEKASLVSIPVYAHVIWGKHKGEADMSRKDVKNAVIKLNRGFLGSENGNKFKTRYRFRLKAVSVTKSDKKYHAIPQGNADKQMKRSLRRGNRWALNLYFLEPRDPGGTLLGWATFPWNYKRTPKLDGVVIHPESVPGGKLKPYNQGDTTIHEVGHWMGLYHTFQGGCANLDYVGDTKAHAYPNYGCPVGSDSCSGKPGKDPVRNYMNYSDDRCMTHFTHGQIRRMNAAWNKYRARR